MKQAYSKIEASSNGKVTLDDVAKAYDVSSNPDVVSGHRQPLELYKHFMGLWDTQVADGVVAYPEFHDYLRDVSASFASDDAFAQWMNSAWKLDQ